MRVKNKTKINFEINSQTKEWAHKFMNFLILFSSDCCLTNNVDQTKEARLHSNVVIKQLTLVCL